jgi:hypothetical protein
MDIDDIFRDMDFGTSLIPRTESTDTWVTAERRRSHEMLEGGNVEDTSVDLQEEDMGGRIILNSPESTSKRERRYSMPTGNTYDAQGDRLAVPLVGPTGRKRELSGGSSKSGGVSQAGQSSRGVTEDERAKKRKMKGKGKVRIEGSEEDETTDLQENVDLGSATKQ